MRCPICKKDVVPAAPESPFCSERCRLIDLGNWASGKYVIPGPPVTDLKSEPPDDDDEN